MNSKNTRGEVVDSTEALAWRPSRALARGNAAEQILEDLRAQILSGALARGSRLPSEAKLAEAFGVSAATVREAIRGLTSSRLVQVRHGSGAFVTAQPDRVLAESLQAVIQIERISVAHVLGVLSALNTYAAEQAAASATDEQLDELEAALDTLDQTPSDQDASAGLLRFLVALATASGNPLLITLCGYLAGLQVRLAKERSGGVLDRKVTGRLSKERRRVLEAIRARDPQAALAAARAYQERSMKVVLSLPLVNSTTG